MRRRAVPLRRPSSHHSPRHRAWVGSPLAGALVHAVGDNLQAAVESHPNPSYIDHVWITMAVAESRPLLISVNTWSRRNEEAGHDPRVRLGRLRESWETLPDRTLEACTRCDYADWERSANIFYEYQEREALEQTLLQAVQAACRLEAWGTPYHRREIAGIHQIHSRRSSCAVPEDLHGRDGALRFYFGEEKCSWLYLFKFCGQP